MIHPRLLRARIKTQTFQWPVPLDWLILRGAVVTLYVGTIMSLRNYSAGQRESALGIWGAPRQLLVKWSMLKRGMLQDHGHRTRCLHHGCRQ